MTRRQFLATTAAVVSSGHRLRGRWPRVLLDLQGGCLRESLAGYARVCQPRLVRADTSSIPHCAVLLVPAALEISPVAARAIVRCLHAGATVVLESAAGFLDERAFRTERAVLRDYFGITVESPVRLWPRQTPYVDFLWPYAAKLRDFSRVVPLGPQAGEQIGWVDGLPVALQRRSGRGTLIFLGSPVGPALWAGDADATRWLSAVLATVS
ncbi:MAG: hypothetical protein DMD38_04195 [Gemmatimonadetes bacterium]|nr:MAG: hypothetical protein AUI09_06175 [Gemmatimonadetes bacterium 13_2_20CM_2_66_5]OLC88638.1 MAG: hypothetical protein AUI86_03255 [Gemmatimonadetes bacterium 13_1_40CM_3_66_12]PYP97685.1 MAG: hypothetical protein DMD38_04195 [Gemmatimonadota bacterium]